MRLLNFKLPIFVCLFMFSFCAFCEHHLFQSEDGRVFYFSNAHSAYSEIVEVSIDTNGAILHEKVIDNSWITYKINNLLPYANGVIIYASKRKDEKVRNLYLKKSFSEPEIDIARDDIEQILPKGEELRNMAIVENKLYLLTTNNLWMKDLVSLKSELVGNYDWTNVAKIIGVGKYLVAYHNSGDIINLYKNEITKIGYDWTLPIDIAPVDSKLFVVKSKDGIIYTKVAEAEKNPKRIGPFKSGMLLWQNKRLFDEKGLVVINFGPMLPLPPTNIPSWSLLSPELDLYIDTLKHGVGEIRKLKRALKWRDPVEFGIFASCVAKGLCTPDPIEFLKSCAHLIPNIDVILSSDAFRQGWAKLEPLRQTLDRSLPCPFFASPPHTAFNKNYHEIYGGEEDGFVFTVCPGLFLNNILQVKEWVVTEPQR